MPRTITLTDEDIELVISTRDLYASTSHWGHGVVDMVLARIAEADRAANNDHHDRPTLTAIADSYDPCTCGNPDDPTCAHRWNGSPCFHLERHDG